MLTLLQSGGSLTQKLEQLANQPLKVCIAHQGLCQLSLDEQHYFAKHKKQNPRQTVAWIRRTLLYGNDAQPWVQAKSIFLLSELKGNAKRLPHLGTTPIGYVLFHHRPSLPHSRSYHPKDNHPARQTLYDWDGRLIFIEEVFLPALIERVSLR